LRDIAALGNGDLQRLVHTVGIVVILQGPPQPGGLHPDDGIGLRIEARRPAEGLDGDGIALDLLGAAGELGFDHIAQEGPEPG